MVNTPNIQDFFKLLEKKILDSSLEEQVLILLKDIQSKLKGFREECLDYEEKKYFDEFISIKKIPKLLDDAVSKRTVEYWVEKKLFPVIKIGKIRVVKRCDFHQFMETQNLNKNKEIITPIR